MFTLIVSCACWTFLVCADYHQRLKLNSSRSHLSIYFHLLHLFRSGNVVWCEFLPVNPCCFVLVDKFTVFIQLLTTTEEQISRLTDVRITDQNWNCQIVPQPTSVEQDLLVFSPLFLRKAVMVVHCAACSSQSFTSGSSLVAGYFEIFSCKWFGLLHFLFCSFSYTIS